MNMSLRIDYKLFLQFLFFIIAIAAVTQDSSPTVVANGDGNVIVEENTLFTSSFQITYDFRGPARISYYQNGRRIGGTKKRIFLNGSANVSLPAFRVFPMNTGTLFVRVVVDGLRFIVLVFNLTVVNQKSGKSPISPSKSHANAMASFTPQATASTAMAASSAGGGTRAFTDQLTSISSTQTPQPSLTSSDNTASKASPRAPSSESVTEPFLASDVPVSVILPCILIPAFVIGLFLLICYKPCKPCKPCIDTLKENVRIKQRNASSSTVTERTVQYPSSTSGNENGIDNRIDYNRIEKIVQSAGSQVIMKVEETEITLAEKIDGQKISEQPEQGGNEGNLAECGTWL
ncbi:uncharacterized protein [Oscarella lobularis]|uniref:uncharacterized protein isoform X2 n=1 Tax=Oscarella lobularis TaxID=121494 RepID=UPI003313F785